jgi:hypothetical protein
MDECAAVRIGRFRTLVDYFTINMMNSGVYRRPKSGRIGDEPRLSAIGVTADIGWNRR